MDIGALENDAVVVDSFLFFDEVVGEAILSGAVVGRSMLRRGSELDFRDEQPLDERESDSDDRTNRNQNLGTEIW